MANSEGLGGIRRRQATANVTAREVMKPYRKKVAQWNDAMARINVMKDRSERRLASSNIWQRHAHDLTTVLTEERKSFLNVVERLPRSIAIANSVIDIDVATSRLLTSLRALDPAQGS